MPQRGDLKRILILGSGPIVIGQACEFDYSGTQACKALRKAGYEIILINSNPASINEKRLKEWNNEGVVEWWGHRDDIKSVYENSTIACLPSYREGLPKSLLEASASGLPVVTTNVPGCRELISDGVNGFLVPAKNSYLLAEALETLLKKVHK